MAIGPHEGSTGPITGDAPNIPEHHLLRRIGEGAYGEVWLARNIMGVLRAVKIVYRRRFSDERPYEREFNGITKFEPLSRSAEGLVDILQVGRDDAAGFFYYIMELADDGGGSSNETGNPKFDKSCSTAGVEGSGFRLPSNFGSASRDDSQFYSPKSLGSEIPGGCHSRNVFNLVCL